MATINAINSNIPIEVSKGGTGAATLTDHGVLVGSGTNAITALAVGTTGQLLVGASTADPAFASSATGDFTFTSSTANETRIFTVSNTDNTVSATSAARVDITVGGANVADPQIRYGIIGITSWSAGIDNSDSDKYKLSRGNVLGVNDTFVATVDGEVTMPLQPAFLAVLSSQDTNVTGNNTWYDFVCDTEIFDQNGDYNNSTGVFTAPITGRYAFQSRAYLTGSTSATSIQIQVIGSNREFLTFLTRAASTADTAHEIVCFMDMDASDTAYPSVKVNGNGSDNMDLEGTSGSDELTTFSGYLVC